MELRVEAADGRPPPADTFVSVRLGDARKQTRFDGARSYRFPEVSFSQASCHIEVYQRVGTAATSLESCFQRHEHVYVPCDWPDLPIMSLQISASRATAEPFKVGGRDKEATVSLGTAQHPLAAHRVEENLISALREMIRIRPDDPLEFLSGSVAKPANSQTLPPLRLPTPAQPKPCPRPDPVKLPPLAETSSVHASMANRGEAADDQSGLNGKGRDAVMAQEPVELCVALLEGQHVPPQTYLSVRIGEERRQARLTDRRTFHFSEAACRQPLCHIEVYVRRGAAVQHMDGGECVFPEMEIPGDGAGCRPWSLRVCAARSTDEALPKKQRVQLRMEAAKQYLAKHHIQESLLREVIRAKPENLTEILSRSVVKQNKPLPSLDSMQPRPPSPASRELLANKFSISQPFLRAEMAPSPSVRKIRKSVSFAREIFMVQDDGNSTRPPLQDAARTWLSGVPETPHDPNDKCIPLDSESELEDAVLANLAKSSFGVASPASSRAEPLEGDASDAPFFLLPSVGSWMLLRLPAPSLLSEAPQYSPPTSSRRSPHGQQFMLLPSVATWLQVVNFAQKQTPPTTHASIPILEPTPTPGYKFAQRPSVGTWLQVAPLPIMSEERRESKGEAFLSKVPFAMKPSVATWLHRAPLTLPDSSTIPGPPPDEATTGETLCSAFFFALPSVGTWLTLKPAVEHCQGSKLEADTSLMLLESPTEASPPTLPAFQEGQEAEPEKAALGEALSPAPPPEKQWQFTEAPVELRVETADGQPPPPETFLSVRFGDARKQTRFDGFRKFRFPPVRCSEPECHIEVYRRIGFAAVCLESCIQSYEDVRVPCDCADLGDLFLRISAEGSGAEPRPRTEGLQEGSDPEEARLEAQQYLAKHRIEESLVSALREIIRARPEDPLEFLSGGVLKASSQSPPSTQKPQSQEASAAPPGFPRQAAPAERQKPRRTGRQGQAAIPDAPLEVYAELVEHQALPEETFLSVRIGEVRRQARFTGWQRFRFSESACRQPLCHIEVYLRCASVAQTLDGSDGTFPEIEIPGDGAGYPAYSLRVCASRSTEAAVPKKQRVQMQLAAAEQYLAEHRLEENLGNVLGEVIRIQPQNPAEFLCDSIFKNGRTPPPLPDSPSPQPEAADPHAMPQAGVDDQEQGLDDACLEAPETVSPFRRSLRKVTFACEQEVFLLQTDSGAAEPLLQLQDTPPPWPAAEAEEQILPNDTDSRCILPHHEFAIEDFSEQQPATSHVDNIVPSSISSQAVSLACNTLEAPFFLMPSVGSWLLLLPPGRQVEAPIPSQEGVPRLAVCFALKPSVGTWLLPLPPSSGPPIHTSQPEHAVVADVVQMRRSFPFMPSVGSWLGWAAAAVDMSAVEVAHLASDAVLDRTEPSIEETPVRQQFFAMPSVGSWLAPARSQTFQVASSSPAATGSDLCSVSHEAPWAPQPTLPFMWKPSVGTWFDATAGQKRRTSSIWMLVSAATTCAQEQSEGQSNSTSFKVMPTATYEPLASGTFGPSGSSDHQEMTMDAVQQPSSKVHQPIANLQLLEAPPGVECSAAAPVAAASTCTEAYAAELKEVPAEPPAPALAALRGGRATEEAQLVLEASAQADDASLVAASAKEISAEESGTVGTGSGQVCLMPEDEPQHCSAGRLDSLDDVLAAKAPEQASRQNQVPGALARDQAPHSSATVVQPPKIPTSSASQDGGCENTRQAASASSGVEVPRVPTTVAQRAQPEALVAKAKPRRFNIIRAAAGAAAALLPSFVRRGRKASAQGRGLETNSRKLASSASGSAAAAQVMEAEPSRAAPLQGGRGGPRGEDEEEARWREEEERLCQEAERMAEEEAWALKAAEAARERARAAAAAALKAKEERQRLSAEAAGRKRKHDGGEKRQGARTAGARGRGQEERAAPEAAAAEQPALSAATRRAEQQAEEEPGARGGAGGGAAAEQPAQSEEPAGGARRSRAEEQRAAEAAAAEAERAREEEERARAAGQKKVEEEERRRASEAAEAARKAEEEERAARAEAAAAARREAEELLAAEVARKAEAARRAEVARKHEEEERFTKEVLAAAVKAQPRGSAAEATQKANEDQHPPEAAAAAQDDDRLATMAVATALKAEEERVAAEAAWKGKHAFHAVEGVAAGEKQEDERSAKEVFARRTAEDVNLLAVARSPQGGAERADGPLTSSQGSDDVLRQAEELLRQVNDGEIRLLRIGTYAEDGMQHLEAPANEVTSSVPRAELFEGMQDTDVAHSMEEQLKGLFPEHAVPLLGDDAPAWRAPVSWCHCERQRFLEIMEICDQCKCWVAPLRWGMQMPNFERTQEARTLEGTNALGAPEGASPPRTRTNKRPTRPKRPTATPPEENRQAAELGEQASGQRLMPSASFLSMESAGSYTPGSPTGGRKPASPPAVLPAAVELQTVLEDLDRLLADSETT